MVDWQGAKPGTFVNNSTVEPVSAENLNAIVNTIDKIATGGEDSGLNADTIRNVDFDALATTSDENLTNFYSFDSLTGVTGEQLIDDGGLNLHGTAYNVSPVKGIISMAGSFNGTSSYASCPYTNKTAVMLALWYKGTATGDKSLIILKRANNALKICLCLSSGYAQTKFLNTDSVLQTLTDTTTLINDNVFHHIAVTHTGSNCYLFVDGVLKQSISQTLTTLYYNQLVIGASEEVTPTIFTSGIFDDVRIYNAALTQNQIYGLYFNKINTKVDYKTTINDISTLAGKITPLSDLSRVMRINGDSVPTFPDNVAGRAYWNDTWPTVDSFTGINCSVSISGGALIATATSSSVFSARKTGMSFTSRLVRIKFLSFTRTGIYVFRYHISSTLYQDTTFTVVPGKMIYDVYLLTPGTYESIDIFCNVSGSTGDSFSIDTLYIGSGLYDTPVYDKACCNRATNNGALPVPAPRGMGLSFNGLGANPLVFDNPVIGTTGTIRFKFKTPSVFFVGGTYFGNKTTNTGVYLYSASDGVAIFRIRTSGGDNVSYSLGTLNVNTEYSISLYFTLTNLYVYKNGLLAYTYTLTASVIQAVANLYIGRDALESAGVDFTLYDFEYVAEAETLNAHIRFMNGDDAVDSQQKSVTGTPHAIAVNDANGFLGSNGLRFPATQVPSADANTLDDYEEGTFTPAITFGGNAVGLTYSNRYGYYTKIGRMVQFSLRIVISAVGSSTGAVSVTGLPFVSSGDANHSAVSLHTVAVVYNGMMTGYVYFNASYIYLYSTAESGASTQLNSTNFTATSTVFITGVYHTT